MTTEAKPESDSVPAAYICPCGVMQEGDVLNPGVCGNCHRPHGKGGTYLIPETVLNRVHAAENRRLAIEQACQPSLTSPKH